MTAGRAQHRLRDAGGRRGRGPNSYLSGVALERHRDAGHAEQRAFHRSGHGPRVGHIVAKVVSLVDAGHDQVGQPLVNLRDRDVDAVGRRAVHLVDTLADSSMRSGRRSVSAWPIALASIWGATMTTSPSGSSDAASAWIPSERTPSSLVTRMRNIEPRIIASGIDVPAMSGRNRAATAGATRFALTVVTGAGPRTSAVSHVRRSRAAARSGAQEDTPSIHPREKRPQDQQVGDGVEERGVLGGGQRCEGRDVEETRQRHERAIGAGAL